MKKKIKFGKIIVSLLIIAVIITIPVCLFIFKDKLFSGKKIEIINNVIKAVSEPKIEEYNLSMVAVGDALIHAGVYQDAHVGNNNYNFKPMLDLVKPWIAEYDLKFYNQETIIGGKHIGLSHYPMFNSPDEIALDMLSTGFNVVGLANNHTMDRGAAAVRYSLDFWKKQDAYTAGSYNSQDEHDNIKVAEINGITYAMIAYTYGTNGLPVPRGEEYLANVWTYESEYEYEAYKAQVKKDIERIRDKVDFLIVSAHWGVEYTHTPTSWQKDQAKFLASLGVDVIIGHHPHVIQPIEFIDNTLVIYSLGNFISAQIGIEKLVGSIVGFDVKKTVADGKSEIKIENVRADLHYTYYSYSISNFKVYPFHKLNDNILPGYKGIYDQFKAILLEYNKNIKIGI